MGVMTFSEYYQIGPYRDFAQEHRSGGNFGISMCDLEGVNGRFRLLLAAVRASEYIWLQRTGGTRRTLSTWTRPS